MFGSVNRSGASHFPCFRAEMIMPGDIQSKRYNSQCLEIKRKPLPNLQA